MRKEGSSPLTADCSLCWLMGLRGVPAARSPWLSTLPAPCSPSHPQLTLLQRWHLLSPPQGSSQLWPFLPPLPCLTEVCSRLWVSLVEFWLEAGCLCTYHPARRMQQELLPDQAQLCRPCPSNPWPNGGLWQSRKFPVSRPTCVLRRALSFGLLLMKQLLFSDPHQLASASTP